MNLIGGETALPAIGRRVENLRSGVPLTTISLIPTRADQQHFQTEAAWTPIWAERDPSTDADIPAMLASLRNVELQKGDEYVWIVAEAPLAKALRTCLIDESQHPKQWLKAAGYWQRGASGTHETIDI